MYNPFSLLRTLDSQAFKDYWFETGTPTILVEALKKTNYNLAEDALQQIEDKQYAKPFEHDGRMIYKIGVNFSSKTRRMEGWKILS